MYPTIDMMTAHQSDLAVAERTIQQRIEWQEISRIDRLEHALQTARARLPWNGRAKSIEAS